MKANSEEERDKWFYALKFLTNYSPIQTKPPSNNLSDNKQNEEEPTKKNNEVKDSKETKTYDLLTILEMKRIRHFLKDINPNCLKNRLCFGYLMKKGQENLSHYRKRWFLLISAKPLVLFLRFTSEII